MYLVGKIYDGLKAIPTAAYQAAGCATVIAVSTFMAMRPSELEKKVVEQKVIAPSKGGGSAGPLICPPIIPDYKHTGPSNNGGSFGEFDFGGFDEKPKASALPPSQK